MDCAKLDQIQKQYEQMGEMIKKLRSQTSCSYPPPPPRVCQEGWFSGEEDPLEETKKALKKAWPF